MSLVKQLAIVTLVTLVTACGGGGGGGSSGGGTNNATPSSSGSGNTSGTPTNGATSGGVSTPSTPATPSTNPTPTTRTITLSWTSPSTREDGSALPLGELSGYQIYYFLDGSENNDTVVPVSGGTTQSQQITLNSTGTYYFAIAAVDSNGLVSDLSNYVSLAVN